MHRLANLFALAHTPSRRRDRFVARPVKISPPTTWRAFHRKVHFFSWRLAAPAACNAGLGPHHTSLLGSSGFAATRPRTTPLHRNDAVLLCANTVVSARPPFTSANRFDADASLGQTQPFDFCNEFSITTHEHITASAALARRRGLPYDRCHARCAFHAALPILFCNAKMVRARCAAASYA